MSLKERLDIAYEALLEHADRSRVLLLHPGSKYRTILLAKLINNPEVKSYYYALGPDDVTLRNFIGNFISSMSNQHDTFGRHLNMLPHTVYDNLDDNMEAIQEAFAEELEEISQSNYLLVLDEYDRSDSADDLHRFIEKVADHLPPQATLVLNSRTLPRLPWVSMVAKKQAALLLDEQLIQEDFYNTGKDGDYDLEVFALGPGYVLHQGEEIKNWEGHLPRLLFFFALDKPMVTRSEICSAFWPDLATDQAVNVFHVTKRRLHKALGFDVMVHQDSHYQINPELNVYYDVLDFVETLMRGRNPNNPNAFEDWKHAVDLYRGPFLQGHNDEWIEERRKAFRTGYLEALTAMARMWIEKDRKELALKLYRQALDEDFLREDFHRDIMNLYTDLGRRSEAVAHFKQLEETFKEEGRKLSDETTGVYNEIVS